MKNKKLFKRILTILSYILFWSLWYFVLVIVAVGRSEGLFSLFSDAFGNWILWGGGILVILSITSIVSLRFFIKKEWLVHLISYSFSLSVLLLAFVFLKVGENKFKDFTTEKWIQYPSGRIIMYLDLKKNYDIIGCSIQEIEKLLGNPDRIFENNTYVYEVIKGNAVYVTFENGKVLDCYFIE